MPVTVLEDIYQGEGKWVKFTYTNKATGEAITLPDSEDSYRYHVKEDAADAEPLFEGDNWDLTQVASGIVRVNMPASFTVDLDADTSYLGQLEVEFTEDTDVDKTQFVKFKILDAVVD
jgi:hypothetical protein